MVNGIFAADLALYLVLFPLAVYNFWTHRWVGCLAWYYMGTFCALRIVAGALGVSHYDSIVANILIGIGTSPLVLTIDGLVHEGRVYRNPYKKQWLGWLVIYIVTGLMAAGIALTVTGALDIYRGHAKSNSLTHWEAGSALIVVGWAVELGWTFFSLLPCQGRRDAPRYRDGTPLLYASALALIFVGVRVIYALVSVCTQRRDLSTVYGTTAVRVVLMFLPEALSAIIIIYAGLRTSRRSTKA
ncbi:hypothetical protein BJX65DRAFT_271860 [Aspergillus insuetus]